MRLPRTLWIVLLISLEALKWIEVSVFAVLSAIANSSTV